MHKVFGFFLDKGGVDLLFLHEISGFYAHAKIMNNNRHRRSGSRFRVRLTLTVSVTLMLLVLGLVALTVVAGRNISRDIHEQAGFVAILGEGVTPEQADSLTKVIAAMPYTAKANHVSASEVMDRWCAMVGDNTPMPDINPFLAEIEVAVHEPWAQADSLELITESLGQNALVSEITLHTEMIDNVNTVTHTVTTALLIVGAVLLLISLALINNTVRLSVYSQRFVINTMKLVGATAGFIRKPFVIDALVHGAVAGALAVGVLCCVIWYLQDVMPALCMAVPLTQAAWVLSGVWVSGIVLCTGAALLATNKYLKLGYDDLFK